MVSNTPTWSMMIGVFFPMRVVGYTILVVSIVIPRAEQLDIGVARDIALPGIELTTMLLASTIFSAASRISTVVLIVGIWFVPTSSPPLVGGRFVQSSAVH